MLEKTQINEKEADDGPFFKKNIFLVTLFLKLLEPIVLSLLSNVEVINKFTRLVKYTPAKHGVSHIKLLKRI